MPGRPWKNPEGIGNTRPAGEVSVEDKIWI
jgi:hypothetical protein